MEYQEMQACFGLHMIKAKYSIIGLYMAENKTDCRNNDDNDLHDINNNNNNNVDWRLLRYYVMWLL
jgi:hypothetical protein